VCSKIKYNVWTYRWGRNTRSQGEVY